MMYKILAAKWRTGGTGCVGFIAIETLAFDGEWKAYVGVASGLNIAADEQHIAAYGCALEPQEAQVFFPHLDIAKYKAY